MKDAFIKAYNHFAQIAADTAEKKGWKKEEPGTAIALMHSELSEALEAIRHDDPASDHLPDFSGSEEEFADVIIRIMHYGKLWNLKIAEAVLAKLEYNANRPFKHGGKKF